MFHIIEYCVAMEENELLMHTTAQNNSEYANERSQTQEMIHCMILCI